jgi:hypothetical protein
MLWWVTAILISPNCPHRAPIPAYIRNLLLRTFPEIDRDTGEDAVTPAILDIRCPNPRRPRQTIMPLIAQRVFVTGRVYNRSVMTEIRVGTSAFTTCRARRRVWGGSYARDVQKVCDRCGGGNFSRGRSGVAVCTTTRAPAGSRATDGSSAEFSGRQ